jgi:hypothetical protein
MGVWLSALRIGRPLPPGRFLVLISVRDCVDPRTIVRLEGLGKLKKYNDLIENRTHDLPVCSTVPERTTVPRAPPATHSSVNLTVSEIIKNNYYCVHFLPCRIWSSRVGEWEGCVRRQPDVSEESIVSIFMTEKLGNQVTTQHASTFVFFAWFTVRSWRWRRYVHPKRLALPYYMELKPRKQCSLILNTYIQETKVVLWTHRQITAMSYSREKMDKVFSHVANRRKCWLSSDRHKCNSFFYSSFNVECNWNIYLGIYQRTCLVPFLT